MSLGAIEISVGDAFAKATTVIYFSEPRTSDRFHDMFLKNIRPEDDHRAAAMAAVTGTFALNGSVAHLAEKVQPGHAQICGLRMLERAFGTIVRASKDPTVYHQATKGVFTNPHSIVNAQLVTCDPEATNTLIQQLLDYLKRDRRKPRSLENGLGRRLVLSDLRKGEYLSVICL
jgi:hypothetical protein